MKSKPQVQNKTACNTLVSRKQNQLEVFNYKPQKGNDSVKEKKPRGNVNKKQQTKLQEIEEIKEDHSQNNNDLELGKMEEKDPNQIVSDNLLTASEFNSNQSIDNESQLKH